MPGYEQTPTTEMTSVQVNDVGTVLGPESTSKKPVPADKRVDDLMMMGGCNTFTILAVFIMLVIALAVPSPFAAANFTNIKNKLNTIMGKVDTTASRSFSYTSAGSRTGISGDSCASTDDAAIKDCNYCAAAKPDDDAVWGNFDCTDAAAGAIEQAGANVTKGFVGAINNSATPPILTDYYSAALCPVNVHWHLGAEHLSVGEFDEFGSGPCDDYAIYKDDDKYDGHAQEGYSGYRRNLGSSCGDRRKLASGGVELGYQCHHYTESDTKFTTPFDWHHCTDMVVGQTYEIHWPHSTVGACNTPYQYQTPFYDGVFCGIANSDATTFVQDSGAAAVAQNVGVQSQVFTIVNDETYYYPDLIKGMIVANDYGSDMAFYTGSTTGTSRNNDDACSAYSPITWQVDRQCHMISASSFDKMCADMKAQADDMTDDLYAHGARTLVDEDTSGWMWDSTTGYPAHLSSTKGLN
jgi:hypothetical protein